MKLISSTMEKPINEMFESSAQDNNKEEIKIFFQNQITSNYNMDERILKKTINKHVSQASDNDKIGHHVYYPTKKLNNLIIKNKVWQNTNQDLRNYVVYQNFVIRQNVISPHILVIRRVLCMKGSKCTLKQVL